MWKSPRLSDVSDVRPEPESQTFFPPASSFDPERAGGTVAAESGASPPPPEGTAGTVAAEAAALLTDFDKRVRHYEVAIAEFPPVSTR